MNIDNWIARSETQKPIAPKHNLWPDIKDQLDKRDQKHQRRFALLSMAASIILISLVWVSYGNNKKNTYAVEDFNGLSDARYSIEVIKRLSAYYQANDARSLLNG